MRNPILLVCIIVLVIFITIFIVTIPAIWDRFNFTGTGAIGDTIGGVSGPIIGVIGIYYVYNTYLQQVNERWYQINLKKLSDIDYAFQNHILTMPIGNKEEYYNYDSSIVYSGISAFTIVVHKLKQYDKLDTYQRLAIDQFVFEYGRKVKHLEVFVINLGRKKKLHNKDFLQLNEIVNEVYYGIVKINIDTLINILRGSQENDQISNKAIINDPKGIKSQFIMMRENLDLLVVPHPLYTRKK